jgi:phage baseplate assembly protein gpV
VVTWQRGKLARNVLLVSALATSSAHAQTPASWVNPVSGTWIEAPFWSTNPFAPLNNNPPGTTYNALIEAAGGTYTVSLHSPVSISSFTLNAASATLLHSAGTFTLATDSAVGAGTYQLTGGAITGAGTLAINGNMSWSGGTITGGGSLVIEAGGSLRLLVGSTRTLTRPLVNFGTVNFGTSLASLTASGAITNHGYMSFGSIAFGGSGLPVITNTGTIAALGTGTASIGTISSLINSGTIVSNSGTTLIGVLTNSGTLLANTGTLMIGSTTHNTGASIGGTGTVVFAGAQVLNTSLTLSVFTEGAGVTGPGDVVVDKLLSWTRGSFSGTGSVLVNSGATVNIPASSSTRTLARTLVNAGTVNFTTGTSTISLDAATISNSGHINFPGSFHKFPFNANTGSPVFNNQGTVSSNGGSLDLASTWGSRVDLINSGTFLTNSGTLLLGQCAHNTGSYFGGTGTVVLNPFGRTQTLNATPVFDNTVTVLDDGTLSGAGDLVITKTFNWSDGTITGAGSVLVSPGGTFNLATSSFSKTLSRTLVNSGTTNILAGTATIQLINGRVDNHAYLNIGSIGSSFEIRSGGGTNLITNTGTITSTHAGRLGAVAFINAGTIIAASGSVALSGTSVTHETGSWIGGTTLVLNGASATHFQTLNGTLTLAANHTSMFDGGITGNGDLVIQKTFDWHRGDMSGQGSVFVEPGATLNVGVSGTRSTSRTLNNAGTVNLVGAAATLALNSARIVNSGVMNLSTGSTTLAVPFNNGSGTNLISSTGRINVLAGPVSITVPLANSGSIVVSQGSALGVVEPFVNTGSIDLNGALVVDYTSLSPLSGLVEQIGTSIVSTAALSDPARRIGYGEASELGLAVFAGLAVDSTAAILALSFGGDTDLDGDVDVADLGRLATNWQAGGDWFGGDFDYNGTVEVNDLGLLASNWQAGTFALAEAAASLGLGSAAVPEPAAIGLLLAALLRRRQRRISTFV